MAYDCDVLFRMRANTDPRRDTTFIRNPCDALDHAQSIATLGSHMGIDATRKLPTEGYDRVCPVLLKTDDVVQQRVDAILKSKWRVARYQMAARIGNLGIAI